MTYYFPSVEAFRDYYVMREGYRRLIAPKLEPGPGNELAPVLREYFDRANRVMGLGMVDCEAILVSAGYDAHRHDPLAELEVTEEGYRRLGVAVGALARRLKIPGVALTLEGGYDLDALRASAAATVSGLLDGLERSATA